MLYEQALRIFTPRPIRWCTRTLWVCGRGVILHQWLLEWSSETKIGTN